MAPAGYFFGARTERQRRRAQQAWPSRQAANGKQRARSARKGGRWRQPSCSQRYFHVPAASYGLTLADTARQPDAGTRELLVG
eukprot:scaffold106966_cov60-Phaeocystis_antarctica.AAC.2